MKCSMKRKYINDGDANTTLDPNTDEASLQNGGDMDSPESENISLHSAILDQEPITISDELLQKGADIQVKDNNNLTPLQVAVRHGIKHMASLLIEKGALFGEDLDLLLDSAIKQDNNEVVKKIIDHDMQNPSINFTTHLQAAAAQGNPQIIELIIPHCKSPQPADRYISKDIVIKTCPPYDESVKMLLKYDFIIPPGSHHNKDFIYAAVKKGYLPIVLQLLKVGIDVNIVNPKTDLSLLGVACLYAHHEVVEKLLEHNADVNGLISFKNRELFLRAKEMVKYFTLKDLFLLRPEYVGYMYIAVLNSDSITMKNLLKYGITIPNHEELFNLTLVAAREGCVGIVAELLNLGIKVTDVNPEGEPILHLCVHKYSRPLEDGIADVLKLLLDKGADEYLHVSNNPLVHKAIDLGLVKIARLFLNYNPDVQYICPHGYSALHKAIKYPLDAQFIKTLLKLNSPVNTLSKERYTPLLDACASTAKDKLEVIQELLNHNATVNYTNAFKVTPLHYACLNNSALIVKTLLEMGADPNFVNWNKETPLHVVCQRMFPNTLTKIKLLVEHGADITAVDAKGRTPLFHACKKSNYEAVKFFLEHDIDVNQLNDDNETPFYVACQYWDSKTSKVVELLLEYGANIEVTDAQGNTQLLIACKENDFNAVEHLVEYNANVNAKNNKGQTPLIIASKSSKEVAKSIVQHLLDHGANIEDADDDGFTPLLAACQAGQVETMRCLLDNDANVHAVNNAGHTPFYIVCMNEQNNYLRMTEIIFKYYEDIDSVDKKGLTLLAVACTFARYQIVRFLLDKQANPNYTDLEHSTPLHHCIQSVSNGTNYFEDICQSVQLLLNYGANVDITDENNLNPLHYAIEKLMFHTFTHRRNSFMAKKYSKLVKILVAHKIKLKAVHLSGGNDSWYILFDYDDRVIIDYTDYSANDILLLNIPSHDYKMPDDVPNAGYHVGDIREVQRRCEREIDELKKESTGIDNLNFYDLLRRSIRYLSLFINDGDLLSLVKEPSYNRKFPCYIEIIRNRLRHAEIWNNTKEIRKSAREHFKLLVTEHLPDECVDMILNFIKVKELKKFLGIREDEKKIK